MIRNWRSDIDCCCVEKEENCVNSINFIDTYITYIYICMYTYIYIFVTSFYFIYTFVYMLYVWKNNDNWKKKVSSKDNKQFPFFFQEISKIFDKEFQEKEFHKFHEFQIAWKKIFINLSLLSKENAWNWKLYIDIRYFVLNI